MAINTYKRPRADIMNSKYSVKWRHVPGVGIVCPHGLPSCHLDHEVNLIRVFPEEDFVDRDSESDADGSDRFPTEVEVEEDAALLCRLVPKSWASFDIVDGNIPEFTKSSFDDPGLVQLIGEVQDYIPSHCGYIFDRYLRQNFGEQMVYATDDASVSRDVPGLWSGRRLKFCVSVDSPKWHYARVKTMTQTCHGRMAPGTTWSMALEIENDDVNEFDTVNKTFAPGTLVQLHQVQESIDGMLAVVLSDVTIETGRCCIQVLGDAARTTVSSANLSIANTLQNVEVHRLHPETGGTLVWKYIDDGRIIPSDDNMKRISFEWIDPPVPALRPLDSQTHATLTDFAPFRSVLHWVIADQVNNPGCIRNSSMALVALTALAGQDLVEFGKVLMCAPPMELVQLRLESDDIGVFQMIGCVTRYRIKRGDFTAFIRTEAEKNLVEVLLRCCRKHSLILDFELAITWLELESMPSPSIVGNLVQHYFRTGSFKQAFELLEQYESEATIDVAEYFCTEVKQWLGTNPYVSLDVDTCAYVENGQPKILHRLVVTPPLGFPKLELGAVDLPIPKSLSEIPEHALDYTDCQSARADFVALTNGNIIVHCKKGESNETTLEFFAEHNPNSSFKAKFEASETIPYGVSETFKSLQLGAQSLVVCRAFHLLVRSHFQTLHVTVAIPLAKSALRYNQALKRWHDAYDVARIEFWLGFLKPTSGTDITDSCCQAGLALESVGRFSEAGRLYEQMCTLPNAEISALMECAGYAQIRANEFEQAETTLFNAASHSIASALELNSAGSAHNRAISSLVNLYGRWSACSPETYPHTVLMPFICLLHCSTPFKRKMGNSFDELVYNVGRDHAHRIIRAQYHNKTLASLTIRGAISGSSRELFYSIMKDVTKKKLGPILDDSRLTVRTPTMTSDKIEVRKVALRAISSHIEKCCSCEKMTKDAKYCPCYVVAYCCKECQVADWENGHRDTCPYRRHQLKKSAVQKMTRPTEKPQDNGAGG